MTSLLLVLFACTSAPPAALAPAFTLGLPAPDQGGFVAHADGVSATSGRHHARFGLDGSVFLGSDLRVQTTSLGRKGASVPVQPTPPQIADCQGKPCVQFTSSTVTEWWLDRGDGFEQGWTVQSAPVAGGELVVDLAVTGEVALRGAEAQIRTPSGGSWTVSGLHAWDADGITLPSRFEATPGGLRIAVEDAGAHYPVRIDPEYATPDFILGGDAFTVAGGGDVNGDGFVDVFLSGRGEWGFAYVFLGTATGFETLGAPVFDYLTNNNMDYIPIAVAGDVNADGYDDVIASGDVAEHVYIYAGSAGGTSAEPSWTLSEHAGGNDADFGPVASVAGAGDVNGDGYDDIVIGVPSYDSPGRVTVHLGSPTGILDDATTMELHADGDTGSDGLFGFSVGGAGDVNGDGYDDIIVGSNPGYTAVYYGSATGVSEDAMTTVENDGTADAVDGAGDVNGDGYDDVIVGVSRGAFPWTDLDPSETRGKALVFLGGSGGVSPSPTWVREGADDYDLYGRSVASAGDVNGDGYGDVITGTQQVPDIFLGSATGLEADPVATLTGGGGRSVSGAGDVDRDGFDDVVVATGSVYLASTFLRDADTDTDSDSDADSDSDSDTDTDADSDSSDTTDSEADSGAGSPGCGGEKQGCATVPDAALGVQIAMLALGLSTWRRRAHPQR